LRALKAEAPRHARSGPILLSFTADPYQPLEAAADLTGRAIGILSRARCSIRLLTKAPALAMARDGDLLRAGGVDCGVTLCFTDDASRREWEPNAGTIAERLEFLRWAHGAGLPTWLSVEPVIDPEQALAVIRLAAPDVDVMRIGRLNHLPEVADRIDWRGFLEAALGLLRELGAGYRIKDALWRHANSSIRARYPRWAGSPVAESPTVRPRGFTHSQTPGSLFGP
jgi:hypothetical protein